MGDDTLTYGHSLMDKWSRLLAKVGPGERTFTLSDDREASSSGTSAANRNTISSVRLREMRARQRKIIASFVGEHLTAADALGMSASWTMALDASPSRRRPRRAHGARVYLGMVIERDQKVHPDRDETRQRGSVWRDGEKDGAELDVLPRASSCGERGSGVATATSDDGARTYDFFCAWALFKNADGKRDSLGAEIKFVCRRDDGEWRSTGSTRSASTGHRFDHRQRRNRRRHRQRRAIPLGL